MEGTPEQPVKKGGRTPKRQQEPVAVTVSGENNGAGDMMPAPKRGRPRGSGRGRGATPDRGGGVGRGRGRGRGRGTPQIIQMKQELIDSDPILSSTPGPSTSADGGSPGKKRGGRDKTTPSPVKQMPNEDSDDGAEGEFSYNDLFSSGEEVVSEDSEYEPTREEMRIHARSSGKSRGRGRGRGRGRSRAGMAGSTRSGRGRGRSGGMEMAEVEVSSEDDEDDDEDLDDEDMDEDEDEDLLDDDEDDESGLDMEDEDEVELFQDASRNQVEQKDIYDFDAQSIISSQKDKKGKLKIPKPQTGRLAAVQQRQTKAQGQSWGSNIYSSVATALKSRDDLDIYTQFLKMRHKNDDLDGLYTDLCKPSTQHSGMFYGPSASLQSMMSRINDHDKVVEILHEMMDKEYAHLAHNVAFLLPISSQPMLGSERLPSMEHVAKPIDRRMRLEYAYMLNMDTNVLAPKFDVGHHPGDVQTIIVSDVAYEKFRHLVISGSPSSLRLTIAVSEDGEPLAIGLLDTWLRAEVPHNRVRVEKPGSLCGVEEKPVPKKIQKEATAEEEVKDLLNEIIDWVVIRTEESPIDSAEHRRRLVQNSATTTVNPLSSANIQLKDAILLKPNGKKDVLLIITGRQPDHKIYAIMSEYRLIYQRYGFIKDTAITLEGMYNAYPDDLMAERSLLIIPDILFKAFKKLSLKNVSNNAPPDCKFALLDREKRNPLSIVVMTGMSFVLRRDGRKPKKEGSDQMALAGMLSDAELDDVRQKVESGQSEPGERFQLVVLNGLLYGMQMADIKTKMVKRFVTLLPTRLYNETLGKHPTFSASQSKFWSKKDTGDGHVTIHVTDEESGNTTYCIGSIFSKYEAEEQQNVVSYFVDNLCDLVFDYQVSTSLYDQVFRLAQANTPDLVEAPSGENQAIEQWGVCSICAKELKSHAVMFDHELRHLGITKFKCPIHELTFTDRKQYKQHLDDQHATKESHKDDILLVDSDDETGNSGSQSHILKAMLQRMEAPQCDKCGDYFPSAEVYAQHFEVCDKVSFQMRSPLPRAANSAKNVTGGAGTNCVCGLCGQTLSNRDKIRRHFISLHLTCCVCQGQCNTIEELAYHMKDHLSLKTKYDELLRKYGNEKDIPEDHAVDIKSMKDMRKILKCDVCNDFHSTRYTFFFHQWTEHGLIHPPLQASDLANLSRTADDSTNSMGPPMTPHRRKKLRLFKDELSYQATGLKKFNCKLCSTEIRVTGNEYVKHLQAKHGLNADINCVCRICAELFGTMEQLSEHLKEVHVPCGDFSNAGIQTIFACEKCPFWGFNKTLLIHSRDVHGDEAPSMYACPHCGERFKDRKFWRAHLDRHSDQLTHECHVCHKAFRMRQTLLQHIRNTHIDNADGPVTCDYCGQVYPRRVSLRHHIYRMHTIEGQEMRHECDICARRFRLETEMRRHVKEMHSGALECDICNKMCPNLRCLTQHRQKHFRTRIYQCTDCQATFKSKLAMKRHIRVEHLQLGPEKFQCQICGKVVTQIAMHMLIHKDARFECQICGKKFTKSAYYNEHIRIHRGEKPFECQICGKRFNKKSNLNVHVKFHEKHRDQEGNYLEIKPRGRYAAQLKREKAAQDKANAASLKVDAGVDTSLDDPNAGIEYYATGIRRESDASVDTSDLELWIMTQGFVPNVDLLSVSSSGAMPTIGIKRSVYQMMTDNPMTETSMSAVIDVPNGGTTSAQSRMDTVKRLKMEPSGGN